MDQLRQVLFGISLGVAAAQCHLEHERLDQAQQALDLVTAAARLAFAQLEEMEQDEG